MKHNALTHQTFLGLGLAGLMLMTGCLEGTANRTGLYLPPKPNFAPIDVFIDVDPGEPWSEVGTVSATGSGFDAYDDHVIPVLQDQARGLGADAVIVTDSWIEEDVHYDSYGYAHITERLVMRGIAIHYLAH
jgi:hypothetical protein